MGTSWVFSDLIPVTAVGEARATRAAGTGKASLGPEREARTWDPDLGPGPGVRTWA